MTAISYKTDERHQQILKAFQSALGAENVRDNPATVNAYFGDWLPPKMLGHVHAAGICGAAKRHHGDPGGHQDLQPL